ncbi:MAG: nucleoside triphosphate pyrophosphohydrolase [Candidatus Marinimicrobia bacterium]|nr:nucleoside triphosphate pyrophosphohydrolase [Candidatus Neomarinimicrobiota bacterium]
MSDNSTLCNEFTKLIEIVRTLRGPSGCEWDRAQTATSLSPYFLEEVHETIEAIHENNHQKLKEELGDLLLHIVFQSEIAEENKQFRLSDSIRNINEKLVRRHPHVFGDVNVKNVKEIKQNWEEIKLKEGRDSLMEGLPKTLPALLLARRIQERAAEVGFDWDKIDLVWEKVHEELDELKDALKLSDDKNITLEFGDLLFSLVNLSRFLNINPEEALYSTSKKFVRRFQYIEKELAAKNIQLKDTTLEEMDRLWNQTRTEDNTSPS